MTAPVPTFVVTRYKRASRYHPFGLRLHRADCRMLRPSTTAWPYTPEERIDQHCKVCKPEVNQ